MDFGRAITRFVRPIFLTRSGDSNTAVFRGNVASAGKPVRAVRHARLSPLGVAYFFRTPCN